MRMAPPLQELRAAEEANIKVYVRIRPLSKEESIAGDMTVVTVLKDGKTVQVVEQGAGYKLTTRTFQFDGVLGPQADQDHVMEKLGVQRLLNSVLEGFSATVMACGQTGSGKTYTMSGREEGVHTQNGFGKMEPRRDDGVIARSVTYLFNAMDRRTSESGEKLYSMRASYFEIYNEQVNDLLRLDASPREIRWSTKDGYYVENLLLVDCETLDDVFAVLDEGSKNRKVGSHEMNKDSSRSHCIMTLHIDSNWCVDGAEQPITRYGRMLFVDLAGSERLKKSKSSGDMLRETGNINRSLFTLGKVISALSEGNRGDGVVPYRESMLTKLLMESLGGNSLALMVACVSPSSSALDETLSTLHYGTCAKNIVNAPSVNMDARNKIVMELQMEVRRLKEENALLRARLGIAPDEEISPVTSPGSRSPPTKRAKSPTKFQNWNNNDQKALSAGSTKTGLANSFPDKQLRGLEKLLSRDGNFYKEAVEGPPVPACEKSALEDRHTARSFPLSHPTRACCDNGWADAYGALDRNKHEDSWISSVRNSINNNGLLGTYRGLGGGKCKGQQLNRRNRVSVDHLSSRSRLRSKRSGKFGSKEENDFQGSITVNETAFQRLLKLSTPVPSEEYTLVPASN